MGRKVCTCKRKMTPGMRKRHNHHSGSSLLGWPHDVLDKTFVHHNQTSLTCKQCYCKNTRLESVVNNCGCMRTLGSTKTPVNLSNYVSKVGRSSKHSFHFLNGKWASGHIADFCFHFHDGFERMSLQGHNPAIYLA